MEGRHEKDRRAHWWQEREVALARKFPLPSRTQYRKLWDWDAETGDRYGGRLIHHAHAYGGRTNVVDGLSWQRRYARQKRRLERAEQLRLAEIERRWADGTDFDGAGVGDE